MKLTEVRYIAGSTQIFVKKDFTNTNIGPFSSEESANKFIEKIRNLSYDELKIVETRDPHDYLEEIVAKVRERTQGVGGRRLVKKKIVRRKVPKKVRSLRSSRKKRTRKK